MRLGISHHSQFDWSGEVWTQAVDDRRVGWLALNRALADKRKLATKIMARFSNPADVFRSAPSDFAGLGLDAEKARLFFAPEAMELGWAELKHAENEGFRVITRDDEAYPPLLHEIFDPPLALYCLGDPAVLKETCLAVVGARRPSAYGRSMAESLSREAARRGLVVVSGMAFGIDTESHWGALDAGQTVAVLGSGLDVLYPASNRLLAKTIAEHGAVISEFPLGSQPLGFHFPLRNRIISGLSAAVIVVEATLRSGSLITARLALEQNREVMAVPGNANLALSAGTNWLIQSGAKLVGRWEDVAEALPDYLRARLAAPDAEKARPCAELTPDEASVLNALKPDLPLSVDDLVEATDYSVSELLSILLGLELKEAVAQEPGKKFLRRR